MTFSEAPEQVAATAPTPNAGKTPVIPPPGSPGGDQTVQPKDLAIAEPPAMLVTAVKQLVGKARGVNKKIYAKIEAWRNRRIEGEHPYLYLDGIVMKRTWAGEVRNVSLLVASAVNSDPYRRRVRVFDFEPVPARPARPAISYASGRAGRGWQTARGSLFP